MTIRTLLEYLVGRREAVLAVASSRSALWLGLIFVLSAGFAREYDGEDLWHEPWHLMLPLGASLVTSFALYCLVAGVAWSKGVRDAPFWRTYQTFLSLYWMTAPLAWLYAIPYERVLSVADATQANLCTLGLVSLWRVLLITNVVSVLYKAEFGSAFFVVMLFADTVALVLIFTTPLPVFSLMGGIRLTESEQVLQGIAFLVGFLGILTWLVWFIGTCAVAGGRRRWSLIMHEVPSSGGASRPLWALAWASVLVWLAVLPVTQAEQQLRWQVERNLREGRIHHALEIMSAHERDHFPPHWDPPPRLGYGEQTPDLLDVLDEIASAGAATWVRTVYIEQLKNEMRSRLWDFWSEMDEGRRERHLDTLERLPEGPAVVAGQRTALEFLVDQYGDGDFSPDHRARLAALAGLDLPSEEPHTGELPPPH